MPHVTIEYSANIAGSMQPVPQLAHDVMQRSGLFSPGDIKTRAYEAKHFMVGEKGAEGSFVHVCVYLMEGRTMLQKQQLSDAMLAALSTCLQEVGQVTVDIREMVKDTYRKLVNNR